jgi:catechol 2,3-dioxygenase-like lactoylglutathione lyase family enzyme
MPGFSVNRAGVVLAVSNVERSVSFYTEKLGFVVEREFDSPPYVILLMRGSRLSLAEQGHPANDRPGVAMRVPDDPSMQSAVVVLEVNDALAVHAELKRGGVRFLTEPRVPPWGGYRFFCLDPDDYLVEIEQF